MAYTTVDNPELFFQVKLYTGTGSSHAVTLDGNSDMQPDWVWIKCRDDSHNNQLFDSVRGVHKRLRSDTTGVQTESSESLKSFDSDGFTVGTQANVNASASGDNSFVAWCWRGGTAFSNDASSTGVGTIDSSGISICKWTGTGSNGTVKHGLTSIPEVLLQKNTGYAYSWYTWHTGIPINQYLKLDTTGTATSSDSGGVTFGNTDPTASVFSLGNDGGSNRSGDAHICYIFHSVQGFSKFGLFRGNANADGAYIHLGFRPAWIMIKSSTAGEHWNIHDNKRDPFNVCDKGLKANTSGVDDDNDRLDFLANGFKHRSTSGGYNSDNRFVYYAFAESPFVNSNGVPNNAR